MMDYELVDVTIPEDRVEVYKKLKEQYNPEGSLLRNYQKHLTDMLVEFDGFCKVNGIEYSLAFGTMLGAVRHKGFIPWDDDADLFMDRENYEKLHRLMRGEWHELTDKLSVAMGARPELWAAPYGYIDIFILDKSPDNRLLRFIKQTAAIIVSCLMKCRGRIDANNSRIWKRVRPWYIFLPLSIIHTSDKWKQILERVSLWFDSAKSTHLQCYNNCVGGIGLLYTYQSCRQYVDMEFEGVKLPLFKGYNMMLKTSYGNYMQLPKSIHNHPLIMEIIENSEFNNNV